MKNATFIAQTLTADSAGVATQNFNPFAIGGQNNVFFQANAVGTGVTGTIRLQASADGTTWTDIATTSTAVSGAGGTFIWNIEHYAAPQVRVVANATVGSMVVTVKGFAKE